MNLRIWFYFTLAGLLWMALMLVLNLFERELAERKAERERFAKEWREREALARLLVERAPERPPIIARPSPGQPQRGEAA